MRVTRAGEAPSFSALQKRMHVSEERLARKLATDVPVTYIVFDVLHLDGHSCVNLPYSERRELVERLELRGPHWNISPSFPGQGAAVLETAREQSLEGIVAKRMSSRYFPGRRSAEWVKIAEVRPLEVIICGWRPGEGRRSDVFGSLMLGLPTPEGLQYIGQVGTGFTEEMLRSLTAKLHKLERKTSPYHGEVPRDRAKGAHWVKPALVGEVVFRDWTNDGRLRAPAWRGLRSDKRPEDVEGRDPDGR